MNYKRTDQVFTLASILKQLIEFLKQNHRIPTFIYLPPEEYFYINYLYQRFDDASFKRVTEFLGIPIKPYYDEQEMEFRGL